ncbi:unannotated protein [freshwater metagenome]|uniref:Unannotated protein n=2 Tax=freshwater metagenome TaxID=449393 RepID=A0A6J7UK24_9ZZZZ
MAAYLFHMELLLIRHGLPIRREISNGRADPELSDDGHRQAEHLAKYLAAEQIHAIYASPLLRAHQTAEHLARSHGLDIVTDDGVAEYDRDSNEYVAVEELKASNDPRWQAMLAGEWGHPNLAEGTDFFYPNYTSIHRVTAARSGERNVLTLNETYHLRGTGLPVGIYQG